MANRTKELTGPIPGGITPEEGQAMNQRLPPAVEETNPLRVNKKALRKPGETTDDITKLPQRMP